MATHTTLDLSISGMTCGSCVRHVTEALQAVAGVDQVRVDLRAGGATVKFDPGSTTSEGLIQAVEEAGYGAAVAESVRPAGLPVRGGSGCSCCA